MPSQEKRAFRKTVLTATSTFAILAGAGVSTAAYAQTAPAAPATTTPASAPAADTSDIVVTGVRGKPRSSLDSPTPVDSIGAKDLLSTGHATLYTGLQAVVPSFNMPTKAGSGTATTIQTGALRGLNPDQTLVLVNGQRWHHTALINVGQQLYNGSAPVDFGMIPTAGVDHIEVLREGAAAQYGSDAVAGVINVILKDTPGLTASSQYGQNIDRSDGQLLTVQANYGLKLSDTGFLNLFFSAQNQDQSDRSFPIDPSIQLYPKINGQPDPREATTNRLINHAFGLNPQDNLQFGYNLKQSVGDIELYSFGAINRRISHIPYPPVYNTSANLPQVYPGLFYPDQQIREVDGQVAIGARGEISDWHWDLSSTAGADRAKQTVSQDINASLGPTSPTSFYLGTLISKEWTTSLDVTKSFDFSNGGNLQVSWGLQDRVEGFKTLAGDPASYAVGGYQIPAGQPFAGAFPTPGAFYVPGFRPSDAGSWHRNIIAGYAELGYAPTEKLFIGAAGRYEHYSDSAGGSLVGKVDARYKATDWLVFRGSVGNGFHAPSLVQSHYSNAKAAVSTAAATLGQVITTATLPVDSAAAKALGASPLKPEKSIDASLGVTLAPAPNFSVTIDGYLVKVDHRIALTGILQGAAINTILVNNGLQPNLAAQYFTNAIDTNTKGVDIVANYRKSLGDYGTLRLSAAINLNKTKIVNIIANPAALSSLGSNFVLFDRVSQGYLTDALPKNKEVLGVGWSLGRVDVNVHETHFGGFSVFNNTPSLDRYFGGRWITDLDVRVRLTKHLALAAGANNIFNVYPAANAIPLSQYGYNQYPRISPYGFTGGFYYGRIEINF